ncbi:unnamed protein product [Rotaria sordida]|uniref:Uncharacterized protein n=1 Tax=Rotaria sordida TaxID=392033 RepID=A0A815GPA6_9BILA|nr:unnamed protein product [Rotaria sordida]CAF3882602.1 unnamed protein product [Rotaria sordida]
MIIAGFFHCNVGDRVICLYYNIDHQATVLNNNNQVRFEQIVYTSLCHIAYISISSRQAIFETWTSQSSPAIDDLVKADDDFVSDCDLFIVCIILQKQIEHIGGNKNNIIIPSVKMKLIRDRQHSDSLVQKEHVSPSFPITSTQASSKMESMDVETANQHSKIDEPISDTQLSLNHPCVSCYQTFRTCPKCRRGIEAFV